MRLAPYRGRHRRQRPRRRGRVTFTVLALLAAAFPLVGVPPAGAATFSGGGITIPGTGTNGIGSPYPSTISVTGLSTVYDLNVTLTGLSHQIIADVDVLLAGPGGQALLIFSDGPDLNTACAAPVSGVNLVFDDEAAGGIPAAPLVSGTYRPSDNNDPVTCDSTDAFPGPAPGLTGASLSIFDGTNPTGTWSLYIHDDAGGDIGSLAGWSLTFADSDTEVPKTGTVLDSTGADVDTQTDPDSLFANWSGFDDNVGIDHYVYGASTSSTCATRDVVADANVAAAFTNATTHGLPLVIGTTYYSCVAAVDAAANQSAFVASDGVTIADGAEPTSGSVDDGPGPGDTNNWGNGSSFSANWSGFADNVAITSYDLAISTLSDCSAQDVLAFASVGNVTSATVSATLGEGFRYACVRARDAAGNLSPVAVSNGARVDTVTPGTGTVHDGAPFAAGDIDTQTSTSEIDGSWGGFADVPPGPVFYEHGVSTLSDCSVLDVAGATGTGSGTFAPRSGLALSVGTTYYNCVRGRDPAGNWTAWVASDGVTVVLPGADLEAGAEDSGDPVPAGSTVVYTLRARNLGPSTAMNVLGTVQLPERAVLVGIEAPDCEEPSGLQVVCDFGDMAAGGSVEITVTLRMTHAGTQRVGLLKLRSDAPDPVSNNNSSREATTVTTNTTVVPGVSCTIVGTPQPETLNGTAGGDVICLLGGADVSDARAGADVVYGGAGGDRLTAGPGSDTLNGEAGNDTLHAIDSVGGNDAVHGGGGTDTCKKDSADSQTGCP